jgi:serine protease DegQ
MRRRLLPALPAVLALALLGGCTSGSSDQSASQTPKGVTVSAASATTADIPSIVRRVEPSIVTIYVGQGLGSGIVYRDNGVIITNEHVVHGSQQVEVVFADGRRVGGTVQATDPATDLAVVRVSRSGLPAARFESKLPVVGELAIALGSPLGFSNSATAGIVSGLGRNLPSGDSSQGQQPQRSGDLIQTDAAISPGNSGGALVNGAAAVIGMNEAYIPPSAGAVSLGFAIPSATVINVVDQLIRGGRPQQAYLGIQPAQVTADIARELGVDQTSGVLVQAVGEGTPAAAAGLREGDIITSLGGTATPTMSDLYTALLRHKPGEKVEVKVIRGGSEQTITVTLGARPS